MTLDHLWAGWRSSYVNSVSTPASDAGGPSHLAVDDEQDCVFCRIIADRSSDEDRGVLFDTGLTVAMLNAYPYASGHILVMPRRHVQELGDLTISESADLWQLATSGAAAIQRAYSPDGLNLGANLGRAAGAGIPTHLHLHVVPRWVGDTNFMTTVASVRVLPEPLPVSWTKLRGAWST
jgi:ATP adenylyltransferase